ncbi:MAG: DUF1003 domain-containing protein [Acidobacteria bacterium]|nr:DUF1003 domain-containing protein [Acidobacteriota bacterium]
MVFGRFYAARVLLSEGRNCPQIYFSSEGKILNRKSDEKHSSSQKQRKSDRYHEPATVEEVTSTNVETILRLEEAAKEKQTLTERLAKVIADFCGSMTFVWVHVAWFGIWIVANTMPGVKHFDEFPFTFLTLVVSLEAIFLSTFILISQNQETRLAERNNHLDLQINLLTEQENTKMLRMLRMIADKLEIDVEDDPTVQVLEQATRPEKLVEQIEEATRRSEPVKFGSGR